MREIKFRAWDKKNKEWFEDWFCIYPNGRAGVLLEDGNSVVLSTRLVPVQFTGLKDKNGKEIYEGDILQYSNIGKCVVEYGCFNLGCDDWSVEHKTMGFAGNWMDGSSAYCGLDDSKELKIVGNIYENPELMKE